MVDSVNYGTKYCPGDPGDAEFFTEDGTIFSHRHSTLFNLYAFDSVHQPNKIVPTLNLVNCDFDYFLKNQEALILVETNNYFPQDITDEISYTPTEDFEDRYIKIGADNGAAILI